MTAADMKAFIDVKYSHKVNIGEGDGVPPDPVLEPLVKLLAPGQLCKSRDELATALKKECNTFTPYGEKITEWLKSTENNKERTFELYHCDVSVQGFKDYHERLQPWIMFYIDAASYIDTDDDRWHFFVV